MPSLRFLEYSTVDPKEKKYPEKVISFTTQTNMNLYIFRTQFLVKKKKRRALDFNFSPAKVSYEYEFINISNKFIIYIYEIQIYEL